MSRIGNKVITIPAGVEVKIENSTVTVKGPKGELTKTFEPLVNINLEENTLSFTAKKDGSEVNLATYTTTQYEYVFEKEK